MVQHGFRKRDQPAMPDVVITVFTHEEDLWQLLLPVVACSNETHAGSASQRAAHVGMSVTLMPSSLREEQPVLAWSVYPEGVAWSSEAGARSSMW